jgi:outer membrane beta-barrel protein
MNRWVGALAFVLVSLVASAAAGQEIQLRGPLAGAPSCRHCVQYRVGRLSLAPTYGITLQDDFDRAMFVGLNAQFHVHELLAIGVWGAYAVAHVPTSLTSQIQTTADMSGTNPNVPTGSGFPSQVGQLNWFLSAPQVTLIPLRGKLALFQNIFVDTDFYLFLGLGIIGLTERANYDADNPPPCAGNSNPGPFNQGCRASRIALTATFGVGINFYITHFLSLAVEYRAFPFAWNRSGTDENSASTQCGPGRNMSCAGFPDPLVPRNPPNQTSAGGRFLIDGNDQTFAFNQMINFNINIFLPFEPRTGE